MKDRTQLVQQGPSCKSAITPLFLGWTWLVIAICPGLIVLAPAGMAQECRDGCFYSNTYQGVDALPYETAGGNNTAFGYLTLNALPYSFHANTAVGAWALAPGSSSILQSENAAIGLVDRVVGLAGQMTGVVEPVIGANNGACGAVL
jgi:hypothetical protein